MFIPWLSRIYLIFCENTPLLFLINGDRLNKSIVTSEQIDALCSYFITFCQLAGAFLLFCLNILKGTLIKTVVYNNYIEQMISKLNMTISNESEILMKTSLRGHMCHTFVASSLSTRNLTPSEGTVEKKWTIVQKIDLYYKDIRLI